MVQRKPTPEEQLLKLIENPAAAPEAAPAAEPASKKVQTATRKPVFDFGKLSGSFSYFRDAFGRQKVSGTGVAVLFDIKWINRLLLALLIAAVIYFIADLVVFRPKTADILTQVGTSGPVYPLSKSPADLEGRDLSFYQGVSKKRNPFLPPGAETPQASEVPADAAAPVSSGTSITEVLQGLKLVGISWGAEPLAMIEDVATSRTYFLRRTQELRGVKIQEITKDKVTVSYEGQEGELF